MMMKITVLLSILASLTTAPVEEQGLTLRAMEIYEMNYETDTVYCIDSEDIPWNFSGCKDYFEGDIIIALMATNGTPCIYDDTILYTNYSGYFLDHGNELLSDGTAICKY